MKWLAMTGMISAAIGVLASVSLIVFPSFAWSVPYGAILAAVNLGLMGICWRNYRVIVREMTP